MNGATCVNTMGSYQCTCAPGFTGPRCGKSQAKGLCSSFFFFFKQEKIVSESVAEQSGRVFFFRKKSNSQTLSQKRKPKRD